MRCSQTLLIKFRLNSKQVRRGIYKESELQDLILYPIFLEHETACRFLKKSSQVYSTNFYSAIVLKIYSKHFSRFQLDFKIFILKTANLRFNSQQ